MADEKEALILFRLRNWVEEAGGYSEKVRVGRNVKSFILSL